MVNYRKIVLISLILGIIFAGSFWIKDAQDVIAMPVQKEENTAKISFLIGKVDVKRAGSRQWEAGRENMVLTKGANIKTGKDGRLELLLEDGSTVQLKENSSLTIRNLGINSRGNRDILLESRKGKLRIEVMKLDAGSSFRIKTPAAVAGVRGTLFFMDINRMSSKLFVDKNSKGVWFENTKTGRGYLIREGYGSNAYRDGRIRPPQMLSEEKKNEWRQMWAPQVFRKHLGEVKEEEEESEDSDSEDEEDSEGEDDSEDEDTEGEVKDDIFSDITGLLENTLELGQQGENEEDEDEIISGDEDEIISGDDPGLDSDGDGLIDEYESLAWMDSNMQTNPLVADTDGDDELDDGLDWSDIEDAFPQDENLQGSRDSIRDSISEKIVATAEINGLYTEIWNIRDSGQIRQMDAVMERISDAQTGKILTDANQNRVRVEQYVLRPNSQTVQLLNVCLKTAPDNLKGLHTLDWKTVFNTSIHHLSGQEIRDLPWNDYLNSYDSEIVSTASVFPTDMSIKLEHNDNFLEEETIFGDRNDGTQNINSKVLNYRLEFRSAGLREDSDINIKDGSNVIVSEVQDDGSNPFGFYYNLPHGSGFGGKIYLYPYVIGNDEAGRQLGYEELKFNTLGDMLRVNTASIGNNNLQIEVRTKQGGSWHQSDTLIDIIYIPLPSMHWNDELD